MPRERQLLLIAPYNPALLYVLGYPHSAAENFRIRKGSFTYKIGVLGLNGENGRVHARKGCGIGYIFVSAEIEFYYYAVIAQFAHALLY